MGALPLIPIMTGVSAAMQFVGGMRQAQAIKAAGQAQMAEANYRAAQGRQAAGQERAASQRAMIEEGRKTRLATSRAKAVAAASGGGFDPSTLNIIAGLESEGRYSSLSALYEGESRARSLESGADLATFEGQNAYRAAKQESSMKKTETIGKTAMTLFDIYGPKGTSGSRFNETTRTWDTGRIR